MKPPRHAFRLLTPALAGALAACTVGGPPSAPALAHRPDGGPPAVAGDRRDAGPVDACAEARRRRSYLGCAYRAVPTANLLAPDVADDFAFSLVVGNPGTASAEVTVDRGREVLRRASIPPGESRALDLPYLPALAGRDLASARVAGAYRLRSTTPVVVYQFNPRRFRASPECAFRPGAPDRACFSFTNDASLLLPTHSLGTRYIVEGHGGGRAGSFVALVGTAASTVRVTPRAAIAAGPGVPPAAPGEATTYDLAEGEVLQLLARSSLAGSLVEASAPVLVIAGHQCAFVPEGFEACDHLEEVLPPVAAWGHRAVAAVPRTTPDEPVLTRVRAALDGTEVRLRGEPEPFTLAAGRSVELMHTDDLLVEATRPILVTQFLVGASFFDRAAPGRDRTTVGDPAMGIVAPLAQFRRSHAFVAPDDFDRSFVAVTAHRDAAVHLDGRPLEGWSPVPGTPYRVARVVVAAGSHLLEADPGAGVTLYAVAPFTSYLVPAGMDVEWLE